MASRDHDHTVSSSALTSEQSHTPLARSPYRIDQTDLVGQVSIGELRRSRGSGEIVLVGPGRVLYATSLPDVGRLELEATPERLRAVGDALMAAIKINNARFLQRVSGVAK